MLASFNEEAQYILLKSKTEMLNLNHPYIGSEHLVLSILKVENKLTEKLSEYGLTYDTFKTEIVYFYTARNRNILVATWC